MSDALKRYVLHVAEFPDEPFMAEHPNGAWIEHRAHREIVKGFERDIAALKSDIEAQIAIAKGAEERAAGLERDAARYRALRDPKEAADGTVFACVHMHAPGTIPSQKHAAGTVLDIYCDAAIAKDKA